MKLLKRIELQREYIYLVLLGLVAITATLGYRINSISMILLALFYVIDRNFLKKIKRAPKGVLFFYLGYFALHLLGLLYTDNIKEGGDEVSVKLAFLLIPLVVLSEKISKENLYYLFVAFKYWLVAIAIFLIYHKLFVIGGPLFTLPSISLSRLIGIHQAYYSLFFIFSLFFLFYQVNAKKIGVYNGFLQILFFVFFIAVLGARVIFAMALVSAFVFLIQRIINEKGSKRFVLLLIFAIIVYGVIQKTNVPEKFARLNKVEWNLEKNIYNHQVFTFDYDDNTSNTLEMRLIKWYCAYEIVKHKPFLGTGTGDYNDELVEQYKKIDFKKGMVFKYNTHNQIIEEFLKFGIFGGAFFLLFLGYLIYQSFREKNLLLFYSSLTMIAFFMVESALERQHGVLFFTLFITLAYIYNPKLLNQSK